MIRYEWKLMTTHKREFFLRWVSSRQKRKRWEVIICETLRRKRFFSILSRLFVTELKEKESSHWKLDWWEDDCKMICFRIKRISMMLDDVEDVFSSNFLMQYDLADLVSMLPRWQATSTAASCPCLRKVQEQFICVFTKWRIPTAGRLKSMDSVDWMVDGWDGYSS